MTRATRSSYSDDREEFLLDWIDWIVSGGLDSMNPDERMKLWTSRMRELAEVYACR
jgi:hypothetical protein